LTLATPGNRTYCTPPVTIPNVIGGLAEWWHNNTDEKEIIRPACDVLILKKKKKANRTVALV